MINHQALTASFSTFKSARPFSHCVVDDFIGADLAKSLESEFLPYDSAKWFVYKNRIEDKKALNDWNAFPAVTYRFLQYLNSGEFVKLLSGLTGNVLYSDPGLHGGGWHIHGTGGNLNPHFDYVIHPKLGLQRKINLIIYVSSDLKPEHGGHLGLWEHDAATGRPGKLAKEIAPAFARAVIFDTTQNSWHGLSSQLTQPAGIYRKSLAIYYLCDPPGGIEQRGRALFAPREDQKGDAAIEELIRARSDVEASQKVYRDDSPKS